MGKKKFSEGLDELFSEARGGRDNFSGGDAAVAPLPERKPTHKNFLSDLDMLLQEALEESIERYESNPQDPTSSGGKSKTTNAAFPPRASMSGLDALIRQTIDVQEIITDENAGKRRLTVTVDKNKLEKLKAIAKLENAYMKDLLIHLIDEYIEEYRQQKGIEL